MVEQHKSEVHWACNTIWILFEIALNSMKICTKFFRTSILHSTLRIGRLRVDLPQVSVQKLNEHSQVWAFQPRSKRTRKTKSSDVKKENNNRDVSEILGWSLSGFNFNVLSWEIQFRAFFTLCTRPRHFSLRYTTRFRDLQLIPSSASFNPAPHRQVRPVGLRTQIWEHPPLSSHGDGTKKE